MIFLILIYALIAVLSVPGLIKRKEWREFAAFSVLYIIGFVLGLMYVLDIPIPSPMKGLQHFITEILGIKYPEY
ncbi:MAG TPA: hypothetical protein GXX14_09240 [Clostridiaceae bacterium]|nr:hypothetical protein [Clostridiaceae bacterium]